LPSDRVLVEAGWSLDSRRRMGRSAAWLLDDTPPLASA